VVLEGSLKLSPKTACGPHPEPVEAGSFLHTHFFKIQCHHVCLWGNYVYVSI